MPAFSDIYNAGGQDQVSEGISARPTARLPLPPQTAPIVSDTSGTGYLSQGVYRWAIAYLTAAGETALGLPTVTAVPLNSEAVLDQIPLGPAGVIGRNVYRTKADADVYYLVDTIADNTTTTYTDGHEDGILVLVAPTWVLSQGLVQGAYKTYQHVNSIDGDGTPLHAIVVDDVLLAQGTYSGDEYSLPTQTMASPSYLACKVESMRAVNDHVGPYYIDVLINAAPWPPATNLSLEAQLYSDSAGAPSSSLFSNFAFVIDAVNAANNAPFIFRCYFGNAGLIALNTGTTYWLVLYLASIPASWDVQVPLAGSGTGLTLYSTNGTVWTPVTGNAVYGIHAQDVPTEPGAQYAADNGPALIVSSHTDQGLVASSDIGDAVRATAFQGNAVYGNAGSGSAGNFSNASPTNPTVKAVNSLGGAAAIAAYSSHGPQLHLAPASGTGAPVTGTWSKGDVYVDANADAFICITAGTPGVFKQFVYV